MDSASERQLSAEAVLTRTAEVIPITLSRNYLQLSWMQDRCSANASGRAEAQVRRVGNTRRKQRSRWRERLRLLTLLLVELNGIEPMTS